MQVKVYNIKNLEKFFGVIDQCEDKVELITENGDLYNLKSKLSQYASLAKVVFNGMIPEVNLITHSTTDTCKLMNYMMNN